MLVHKESRNLLLHLKNPTRVTEVIPHAKVLPHGQTSVVVVPHREDEIRVLRNLGFDTPSPIATYYDWPCSYESGPYTHQRITAEFMSLNPRGYVLSGMGSGKTLCALWAYDWLRRIGKVRRMLVIAPLSTLTRTWYDEIFTHFPHLTCAVLHASSMESRLKLLAIPHDVYVVNHDALKSEPLLKALEGRDDIDVVTLDELATARTPGTARWKAFNRVIHGRAFVWGMTGAPIPNAPTDAWAQCRLITPHTVPKFMGEFRDMTMRQFGPYKWVARPNALQTVYAAMQPSIRFSREECIDLPPTTYTTRHCDLTPEQRAAFDDMRRKLSAEHAAGKILAVNAADKLNKLVQICCGVAYGVDGDVDIPCTPRHRLVEEIVDESEAKVIVFVQFTSALLKLAEYLRKRGISTECVYGDVSKSRRDEIFLAFQRAENPRVLVADARTMSHGLSLVAASTIVWYGPITSTDTYIQANERIPRPGQKLTTHIVHIESTPVETLMYERIRQRKSVNGLLLEMIEKGI